jgi:OPA family glycerol-3-phosphate transporter-like MFS transporter
MFFSLKPAPHKPQLPDEQVDPAYRRLREQVFIGTMVGYASYYFVRNNFALAMPHLLEQYSKAELGIVSSAIALAYGISKFLMGNVSDRSNVRKFLPLGLLLSASTALFFGLSPWATSSIAAMFCVLFIGSWFQGMGWAPCGRTMVHWFSTRERGLRMAIWNTSHNIGGSLMSVLTILGLYFFLNDWKMGIFCFPAMVACGMAIIAFVLLRDTPQSCGLPSIEQYKNEYPENYDKSFEKEMTAREIFFSYVFNNRFLWYIAIANAFVYLIRHGVNQWAPTYLFEVKEFAIDKASWGYFTYEISAIPGTLLCGWMSDRFFKGRRAPATIWFLALVTVAILFYWFLPPGNKWLIYASLAAIGFLIYGPVMMIGLHALELVPKKAAGTAAGLTGLFGYLFGTMSATIIIGYVVDHFGWNGNFILLIVSCFAAMFFVALTLNAGKHG